MRVEDRPGREMTFGTLGLFFALTFALTWGLAALLILFPEPISALFGELSYTHPLFILAVYSPGFAGIFVVWRHHGMRGLGSFFRRLTLWRMSGAWWLLLIVGIPALFYAGAAIKGTATEPFPFSHWHAALPALAAALFIGPIEELGWRGVALPLLQRRYTPLVASLILGGIWGLWHVPAFLLSGVPQEAWAFGPYFMAVVAISVLLTPMFNDARGSILIAVLFHFQMNNPVWPDAQPWDTLSFSAAAILVVVLNRRTMLSRADAVTGVLMPKAERAVGAPSKEGL